MANTFEGGSTNTQRQDSPVGQIDSLEAAPIIENEEWRWVFISSAILIVLISIPFIWAYAAGAPEQSFTGVLVNPIDGASYQAKMYQGYMGSWLFTLPFTPEPHRGVFLFTYYLMLGHIARIVGVSPILIFNVFRIVGSLLMFVMIYLFVSDWTDSVSQRRLTWSLAVIGAGFGWIAIAFRWPFASVVLGAPTDILVLPEAFPLQSAYTNAHFPLAIAVAVWLVHTLLTVALIDRKSEPEIGWRSVGIASASLVLISISPFVLAPIAVAFAVLCTYIWWQERKFPRREISWGSIAAIFGLPLVAYNIWAVSPENPMLSMWMSQNQTPSPPVWGYLVGFGPLLLLALLGIWSTRTTVDRKHVFLIAWIVSIVLLLYLPIGLQRRFAMGLMIPLSVYAGIGLHRVIQPRIPESFRIVITVLVFLLIIPSNVMSIVIPMAGALSEQGQRYYYVNSAEEEALEWFQQEAVPYSIVLSSREFSLRLPVYGQRVVYGHEFETLNAAARAQSMQDFYTGEDCSVIEEEKVDYVVVGRWEQALGDGHEMCPLPGEPVFESSDKSLRVYSVTATVGQ